MKRWQTLEREANWVAKTMAMEDGVGNWNAGASAV